MDFDSYLARDGRGRTIFEQLADHEGGMDMDMDEDEDEDEAPSAISSLVCAAPLL